MKREMNWANNVFTNYIVTSCTISIIFTFSLIHADNKTFVSDVVNKALINRTFTFSTLSGSSQG